MHFWIFWFIPGRVFLKRPSSKNSIFCQVKFSTPKITPFSNDTFLDLPGMCFGLKKWTESKIIAFLHENFSKILHFARYPHSNWEGCRFLTKVTKLDFSLRMLYRQKYIDTRSDFGTIVTLYSKPLKWIQTHF